MKLVTDLTSVRVVWAGCSTRLFETTVALLYSFATVFIVPTFTLEASKPPCTFRGWSVRSDSVPWVSDSVRIVQQVAVLEISDPPLDGFAMALKL